MKESTAERVRRLRVELREAESALKAERIAAAPFQRGQVVRFRGEPAIVRRVEPGSTPGWIEYYVSPRKKNGEWSLRESWALDDHLEAQP